MVQADGKDRAYYPPEDFIHQFHSIELEQGETPRTAVALETLLASAQADEVEIVDCDDSSHKFSTHSPDRRAVFMVLTGKGTLKVVREERPDEYVNVVQRLRKLTFHKAGAKPRESRSPRSRPAAPR